MGELTHIHDDGWGNCSACLDDFRRMVVQTEEIHAFVKGVAEALNNPMVRAMMPPGMMGK